MHEPASWLAGTIVKLLHACIPFKDESKKKREVTQQDRRLRKSFLSTCRNSKKAGNTIKRLHILQAIMTWMSVNEDRQTNTDNKGEGRRRDKQDDRGLHLQLLPLRTTDPQEKRRKKRLWKNHRRERGRAGSTKPIVASVSCISVHMHVSM